MAYEAPSIGVSGLTIPSYNDYIEYLVNECKRIYGDDIYLDEDSQDYQLLSAFALMCYDIAQCLVWDYNSHNPSTATGVSLDRVASYCGIQRISGSGSSAIITCTGIPGTVVSYGSVEDENGYLWQLEKEFTITSDGTVDVGASCVINGAIQAPIGTINKIKTPTSGWYTATNKFAATPGMEVETDSQLRARIEVSTSIAADAVMDSLIANLLLIDNVLDVKGFENYTSTYDELGLPPHSIAMIVEGGEQEQIAKTIYRIKTPGTNTYGDIHIPVTTESHREIIISFFRPRYKNVTVTINIVPLSTYTDVLNGPIKNAVRKYVTGLEIGQPIYASSLFAEVLGENPNANEPSFYVNSILVNNTLSVPAEPFDLITTDDSLITINVIAGAYPGKGEENEEP